MTRKEIEAASYLASTLDYVAGCIDCVPFRASFGNIKHGSVASYHELVGYLITTVKTHATFGKASCCYNGCCVCNGGAKSFSKYAADIIAVCERAATNALFAEATNKDDADALCKYSAKKARESARIIRDSIK